MNEITKNRTDSVDHLITAGGSRDRPALPGRRRSVMLIAFLSGLILLVLWSTMLGLTATSEGNLGGSRIDLGCAGNVAGPAYREDHP